MCELSRRPSHVPARFEPTGTRSISGRDPEVAVSTPIARLTVSVSPKLHVPHVERAKMNRAPAIGFVARRRSLECCRFLSHATRWKKRERRLQQRKSASRCRCRAEWTGNYFNYTAILVRCGDKFITLVDAQQRLISTRAFAINDLMV